MKIAILKKNQQFFLKLIVMQLCFLPLALGADSQFRTESPDTVIDQAGRRIVVSKPYQRIISLYGAHTENLFSLGLDKEIIGVSRHERFPAQALTKPVFSYHNDPEKFLAARPDLVIVRPMIDRGYPQFVTRLEKSGIVVVSLQPSTVGEMYEYWKILGVLTGRQKQASEMISLFQKISSNLKSLASSVAVRKRVYFESILLKLFNK